MTETIDDTMKKAFWICKHLLAGGCITKEKLMDEFEISDISAKRWMAAASRQLPITELGYLLDKQALEFELAAAYRIIKESM